MAHRPSRPVGAETHHAVDLKRAHSFLAGQHQMDDAEPLTQGLIRVLEDRADQRREPITLRRTVVALPPEVHRGHRTRLVVAAARATDAKGPAVRDEVSETSVLVGKGFLKL